MALIRNASPQTGLDFCAGGTFSCELLYSRGYRHNAEDSDDSHVRYLQLTNLLSFKYYTTIRIEIKHMTLSMELKPDVIAKNIFDRIVGSVHQSHSPTKREITQEIIDRDINGVQAVLKALGEHSLVELAKMRRRRNALTPVSFLPQDILGDVFVQSTDDREDPTQGFVDEDYPSRISTLAKVSSAWNDTVCSTPPIWRHVSTKNPPSFIKVALHRSATWVLNVEIDFAAVGSNVALEKAMLQIVEQVSRWGSAKIAAPSHADLDILTYASAPRLGKLVVECQQGGTSPMRLFQDDASRISHVDLTRVPINGISNVLMGLRSIGLKEVVGQDPAQFFGMLKACPGLVKLRLIDFQFSDSVDPDPTNDQLIEFPVLRELYLVNIEILTLNMLFLHTSYPMVQTVLVFPFMNELPADPEMLGVCLPTLQGILKSVPKPSATRGGGRWILYALDHSFKLVCRDHSTQASKFELMCVYPPGPGTEGFKIMLLEYLQIHTETLVRYLRLSSRQTAGVWEVLDRWTSLKVLWPSEVPDLVNELATPVEESHKLRWHLPHLTLIQLQVNNYSMAEDVLQMVRSRKGRYHPTLESGVTLELPTPLIRLVVPNDCVMDAVTFMKIKMVMGEGATVHWTPESE